MKNVNRVLSTYSSDLFGVCSALYELGGMTVMHDASGCNSTYSTHDEPRWYSQDSMIYISALSEMEAVLGDDEKLLDDITQAAKELHPKFLALGGTPIPMIMGTDFKGLAKVLEKRTGLPAFGFPTNGMRTYEKGAGMALEVIAERFCTEEAAGKEKIADGVNILGATPLDFSINGNVEKIQEILKACGFQVVSTFAMGDTLEQLSCAGKASVNLVISQTGLPAARLLKKRFGIPYVTGIPMGIHGTEMLINELKRAATDSGVEADKRTWKESAIGEAFEENRQKSTEEVLIIGEMVYAASLRDCLISDCGFSNVRIICPLEADEELTSGFPVLVTDEESAIEEEMAKASVVIADPIYRHLLRKNGNTKFVDMPHEAFSGRMYHDRMKVFVGSEIEYCIKEIL